MMADRDIISALIGKINLCEELNAWGAELCLEQLKEILGLIERLQGNYNALKKHEEKEHQYCKKNCEPKYKAEIDKLKTQINILEQIKRGQYRTISAQTDCIMSLGKKADTIKVEAVKEFAERFENELTKIEEIYFDEEHENFISANKVIALLNNLIKEMVVDCK